MAGLVACSSAQRGISGADSMPPTVAGTVPLESILTDSSDDGRPEWIDSSPPDTSTHRFFVGLSESHATEQDAREAAMRDAREQFADYTGVDVSVIDVAESSYQGLSSGIVDATLSEKNRSIQKTDAFVSRIKPVKWYWEKYRTSHNGKFRGYAYNYWVKVSVPLDEYDKVQEWKKNREALKKQLAEQKAAQIQSELDRARQIHDDAVGSIKLTLYSGDIAKALSQIQAEGIRLYNVAKAFNDRGEGYQARIHEITTLKAETDQLINFIQSGLFIDSGRFCSYCILPGAVNSKLPVWVFFKNRDNNLPVHGLKLSLVDEKEGTVVAVSTTKSDGKAEFLVPPKLTGRFNVQIDPQGGTLSSLTDGLTSFLSNVQASLTITNSTEDIPGAIYTAVTGLFLGPSTEPFPVKRVLLGPVTYEDTRQGTSFGQALKRQLRYELGSLESLQVVDPKKRTADDIQSVKTRGIKAVGTYDSDTPSIGSAAIQASIDDADAALETTYSLLGDCVWVDLNIREAGTDILLASSRGYLPKSSIPSDLELKPVVAKKVVPQSEGAGGTVKLDLTSNFGDGQTYTEGETISYFVGTDKDAFVLLIYEDAVHNLVQILPNRYSGSGYFKRGNVLEVPGRDDGYELVIQPPFGLERVWGFASTKPFPRLAGNELDNGLVILSESLETILDQLREHGNRPGVAYGEAQTLLTTVSKSAAYAVR